MVRHTLLVVASACDEHLLHLAGTMIRYAWQGIRTVLVIIDDGTKNDSRPIMARVAFLLGVEQLFHWQSDPTITQRLARTLRAFHPQTLLTTPTTLAFTQAAWQVATDETVQMPGLAVLNFAHSQLWVPQGDAAMIEVPFTNGIRHAIACLFAEGQLTVSAMRHHIAQQEWSSFETFAWSGGAPAIGPMPISDFFGITTT